MQDKLEPLTGLSPSSLSQTLWYFARRFRLDFTGFVEPQTRRAASPSQLAALITTMRGQGSAVIVRRTPQNRKGTSHIWRKRPNASVVVWAAPWRTSRLLTTMFPRRHQRDGAVHAQAVVP